VLFWLPRALLALLAALILFEVFVIAPRATALAIIASGVWLTSPGVVLMRRVFGTRDASGIAACLAGPALGFGFSVFGLLLFWSAGLQNWLAIVLAPSLTWLIVGIARLAGVPTLRVPTFDRRDLVAVSLALLVVPLVTLAPYDHVREPVPDGEAYRAYFTADFVWALTVTSELAKGNVPPASPFLKGETLHYYWMAHFLSGALYRNVRGWGITAEQVVLIDGLAYGLAFVGFFYVLARMAGATAGFAALFVVMGFVANSYEGLNRLWVLHEGGIGFEAVKDYNIDAVTRWFYQGMPVDGLQRLLLYQPHHLTGYVMGLTALWLVGFAEDVTETAAALWAGILLGLAFLFSTFTAIILSAAAGLLYAIRLLQYRAFRAIWQSAVLGAAPAVVGVALTSFLGYTDPNAGSLIEVGVNPVATRRWPLMLFLSFGPLLVTGVAGLLRVRWVKGDGAAAAVLVVVALAFYFLVDVPDMGGVWVGWRSGHQLLIAFSVIGAALFTAVWSVRSFRWMILVALVLAGLPAIPTVAIDIYNAQDITNRNPGPNFPWTLVISPPEREALNWLKRATSVDAVVQFEPVARGNTHWGYIPAFAERRMAAGFPVAMIPIKKFQEASENVRLGIFMASTALDAHAMATFLGIDYVMVGDVEHQHYQSTIAAMEQHPELFPEVFRNEAVTIYGVSRSPTAPHR